MFRYNQLLEKKSTLFSIIVFTVIGVLAIPLILPHIFHHFQLMHILIHLAGIAIASFMSIVSVLAYSKIRTKRMLFTLIAFSIFTGAESLSAIDAAWQYTYYLGDFSAGEIGHILTLCTLAMFAISVFRRD